MMYLKKRLNNCSNKYVYTNIIFSLIFFINFNIINFFTITQFFNKVNIKFIYKNFLLFYKKFCSFKYPLLSFFLNDFFCTMGLFFVKKFKNYLKFSLLHITRVLNYQWEMIYKKNFNNMYSSFLTLNKKPKILFDFYILLKVSKIIFFSFLIKDRELTLNLNIGGNFFLKKKLNASNTSTNFNNFIFKNNNYSKNNINDLYKNSYRFFSSKDKNLYFDFFSKNTNSYYDNDTLVYSSESSFFYIKNRDFWVSYKKTASLEFSNFEKTRLYATMEYEALKQKALDNKDMTLTQLVPYEYQIIYIHYFLKKSEEKLKNRIRKYNKRESRNTFLNKKFNVDVHQVSNEIKFLYYNVQILYNNFIVNYFLKNSTAELKSYGPIFTKINLLFGSDILKKNELLLGKSLKSKDVPQILPVTVDNFFKFIDSLIKGYKILYFKKEEFFKLDYEELFIHPSDFFKKDLMKLVEPIKSKKLNQILRSKAYLNKIIAIEPIFSKFYTKKFSLNIDFLENFDFQSPNYVTTLKKFRFNVLKKKKLFKESTGLKIFSYFNKYWLANRKSFNFKASELADMIIYLYGQDALLKDTDLRVFEDFKKKLNTLRDNFKLGYTGSKVVDLFELEDEHDERVKELGLNERLFTRLSMKKATKIKNITKNITLEDIDVILSKDLIKKDLINYVSISDTNEIELFFIKFNNPSTSPFLDLSISKLIKFNMVKGYYNHNFKVDSMELLINPKVLDILVKNNPTYIPNYYTHETLFYNSKKPKSYIFIKSRVSFMSYYKKYFEKNLINSNLMFDTFYRLMIMRNQSYLSLIHGSSPYIERFSNKSFKIHLKLKKLKDMIDRLRDDSFNEFSKKNKNKKTKDVDFVKYFNETKSDTFRKYERKYDYYSKKYPNYKEDQLPDYLLKGNAYSFFKKKNLFKTNLFLNNYAILMFRDLTNSKLEEDSGYGNFSMRNLIIRQYLNFNFMSPTDYSRDQENNWSFNNEFLKYFFYENKFKIDLYNAFYFNLVKNIPIFINPLHEIKTSSGSFKLDLNPMLLDIYKDEDPRTCYIPENLTIFHIFTNYDLIKKYYYSSPVSLFREILIFKSTKKLEQSITINIDQLTSYYKKNYQLKNKILYGCNNFLIIKNILINYTIFDFILLKNHINFKKLNLSSISTGTIADDLLAYTKISISDLFIDNYSKVLFKSWNLKNILNFLFLNYSDTFTNSFKLFEDTEFTKVYSFYEKILLKNFNFLYSIKNSNIKFKISYEDIIDFNERFKEFFNLKLMVSELFSDIFEKNGISIYGYSNIELKDTYIDYRKNTFSKNSKSAINLNKDLELRASILNSEKLFYSHLSMYIDNDNFFKSLYDIKKFLYNINTNKSSKKVSTFNFDFSLDEWKDENSSYNFNNIDPFIINYTKNLKKLYTDDLNFILLFEKVLLTEKFMNKLKSFFYKIHHAIRSFDTDKHFNFFRTLTNIDKEMLFNLILLYIILIFKKTYAKKNSRINLSDITDIFYLFFSKKSGSYTYLLHFFDKNDLKCINFIFSNDFSDEFSSLILNFIPSNIIESSGLKSFYSRRRFILLNKYLKVKNLSSSCVFYNNSFHIVDLKKMVDLFKSYKDLICKNLTPLTKMTIKERYKLIRNFYVDVLKEKSGKTMLLLENSIYGIDEDVSKFKSLSMFFKENFINNLSLTLLIKTFFTKLINIDSQQTKKIVKNKFSYYYLFYDIHTVYFMSLVNLNLFIFKSLDEPKFNNYLNYDNFKFFPKFFPNLYSSKLIDFGKKNNLDSWFFSFNFLIKIGFLNFIAKSSSFLNSLFFFVSKHRSNVYFSKFWNDRGFFFPLEMSVYKFFFLYYSNFFFNFFETSSYLNFNSFYKAFHQKKLLNMNKSMYRTTPVKKKSLMSFYKNIPKKKKIFDYLNQILNISPSKPVNKIYFNNFLKSQKIEYQSSYSFIMLNLYQLYVDLSVENRLYQKYVVDMGKSQRKFFKIKLERTWVLRNRIQRLKGKKSYKPGLFLVKKKLLDSIKNLRLNYFMSGINPLSNLDNFRLSNLKYNFIYLNYFKTISMPSFNFNLSYFNKKSWKLFKYCQLNINKFSLLNLKKKYIKNKTYMKNNSYKLINFYRKKFKKVINFKNKIKRSHILKFKKLQLFNNVGGAFFILKYKDFLKKKLKYFKLYSFKNRIKFGLNNFLFKKNLAIGHNSIKQNSIIAQKKAIKLLLNKVGSHSFKDFIDELPKKRKLKLFVFDDLRYALNNDLRKNLGFRIKKFLKYNIKILSNKSFFYKFIDSIKNFKILKKKMHNSHFSFLRSMQKKKIGFMANFNLYKLSINPHFETTSSFFFNNFWVESTNYRKFSSLNPLNNNLLHFKKNLNFTNLSKFNFKGNVSGKFWSLKRKFFLSKKIKKIKKNSVFTKNYNKFFEKDFINILTKDSESNLSTETTNQTDLSDLDKSNIVEDDTVDLSLLNNTDISDTIDEATGIAKLNNFSSKEKAIFIKRKNKRLIFNSYRFKRRGRFNPIYKKTLLFFDVKTRYSSKFSKKSGATGFISLPNNEVMDNYNLFNYSKLYSKSFNKNSNFKVQNIFFKNKISNANPQHSINNYFSKIQSLRSTERFPRLNYVSRKSNIIFRMKPGYQVLWRAYRKSFNSMAYLNFYRQRRLTNYFLNFKKANSLLVLRNFEFSIFSIVRRSNFFLDYTVSLLCFRLGMVYLNGKKILNKGIQVYVGDRIQIALTFTYLLQFKWFFFFLNSRRVKFLNKYIKHFFNIKNNTLTLRKAFLEFSEKLFKKFLYYCKDIPNYLEVDFFLMLSTVIYEPFLFYEFDPILIYRIPYLSMRLYNWKYIN